MADQGALHHKCGVANELRHFLVGQISLNKAVKDKQALKSNTSGFKGRHDLRDILKCKAYVAQQVKSCA